MAENPAPPRRRFQFSLRTMLIVVTLAAIPCGWVGWQAKIVRERKAMREQVRIANGMIFTVEEGIKTPRWGRWGRAEPSNVPWIRRWLGDEAMDCLYVPPSVPQSDADNMTAAFPESHIQR